MTAEEQTTDKNPPAEAPNPEADKTTQSESSDKKTGGSRLARFKSWYSQHKRWTIPLTILLVILILAAAPWTRYNLAGLAVKHNLNIEVMDATANTPVSGATVSIGSDSAQTDAAGKATLPNVKAGRHQLLISKKYYQNRQISLLSPIFSQKTVPSFSLTATGRQVRVSVTNLINHGKLGGVDVQVADVSAKTDNNGSALLVLPAGDSQATARLSLTGYNDATDTVKVSDSQIVQNNFMLTPAGKVYFLSNLSGNIDVVKTNLDGTGRQTVLAGTGNEDSQNTVLLASRDWKYLALLSRRAGNYASLYLIDTSNDSVTTMDDGNADFSLIGWVGDDFAYFVTRNDVQNWQSGQEALKSYNAATKKITVLDQTTASGTNANNYISQSFPVSDAYGYDGQVYYVTDWGSGFTVDPSTLQNKQDTLNSINIDGSGKKAIKSFAGSGTQTSDKNLDDTLVKPGTIELAFYYNNNYTFYTYANGQVTPDSKMTVNNFYSNNYPTYLESPSGNQTFWSEPRDGKNTLFTGDEDGGNGKQIATLSDYSPYGWYTDNYVLVSKDSSELYIMPGDGSQPAVKISDYYKPAVNLQGYGGGYGGGL